MAGTFADRPTAVVMDADSRLGEAVARALALNGFHVVAATADAGRAAGLAASIGGTAIDVDIASEDSVRSFSAMIPHASVLVVAGTHLPISSRADSEIDAWRWRWEGRILGTLRIIAALQPRLTEARGLVVTITAGGAADPGSAEVDEAFHERTLYRLITAQIDDAAIRVTRIRSAQPTTKPDTTPPITPSQAAALLAPDDVAEVVVFAVTRRPSASLLLDEIVIRPSNLPTRWCAPE